MKNQNKMIPLFCLLALASCGDKNSSDSNSPVSEEEVAQAAEGTYKAILRPYNKTLSGWIPNGMADIQISDGEIEVKSWLDDSANVTHRQTIHLGKRCPDVEDDANGDGFVDFNETLKVAGKAIIPLDGDLSAQAAGGDIFPKGNFSYYEKASFKVMMNDLKLDDPDRNDFLAKLAPNQGINLEGKVIIVTGVSDTRSLPGTVSTLNGLTPQESIPIACGVIKRTKLPDHNGVEL